MRITKAMLVRLAFLALPFTTYAATQCTQFSRALARGSRGVDVSLLQTFLISQNLLAAGNSTGYFGILTEGAVQQFQCAHNIVCSGTPATTGRGVVGMRTRAAIAQVCSVADINVNVEKVGFLEKSIFLKLRKVIRDLL